MTTWTIETGDASFDGDAEGVSPGDIIEIEAGSRGALTIRDVVGTSGSPIYIVNAGGVSSISAAGASFGLYIRNCRYFVLSGRAYENAYGIVITNWSTFGLFAVEGSDHFTIEGIEIGPDYSSNGGGGMAIQTDVEDVDPFTLEDVEIRYCYIHDADTEGIYYNNDYDSGEGTQPFDGVEIHHCLIESCGWESIQLKNGENAEIHHNRIIDGGAASGASAGQSGAGIMVIGGYGAPSMQNYDIHHNTIDNCARGIEFDTFGDGCSVYRNHILNSVVVDTWGGEGIKISTSSHGIQIYENTCHTYEDDGIQTAGGDTGTGSERLDSNICCSDEGGATHINSSYANQQDNATGSVSSMDFEPGDYNDTIGTESAAWAAGSAGIHCGWKQATW